MIKRMGLEAVYHEKVFLEIMAILAKYKVTDCCLSINTRNPTNKN